MENFPHFLFPDYLQGNDIELFKYLLNFWHTLSILILNKTPLYAS